MIINYIYGLLFLLSVCSCTSQTQPKEGGVKSYREYNLIEESSLEQMKIRARNGSCQDCVLIYRHYYIGLQNKKEGLKWLLVGQKHGCRDCMRILRSISES